MKNKTLVEFKREREYKVREKYELRIMELLHSGAPSRAIARTLNEEGFCFITSGFEYIHNGYVYEFDVEQSEFVLICGATICFPGTPVSKSELSVNILSQDITYLKQVYKF